MSGVDPRAILDNDKVDTTLYNAINHGCPDEIVDRYLQARALLNGTGFYIMERHIYPTEAPWAKPKCCGLVMLYSRESEPPLWQCWGCGAVLASTEREDDWTPPEMPEWRMKGGR